jgi:hypothetical protein
MDDIITNTNWKLLAKQKASALEFIAVLTTLDPSRAKDLRGLLHFIQDIQYYIVNNGLAPASTIYPAQP